MEYLSVKLKLDRKTIRRKCM